MLFGGIRETGQFAAGRYILQTAYVLALLWYLIRSESSVAQMADRHLFWQDRSRILRFVPAIVILLLLVTEFLGQGILLPLLLLATIWILVLWRREISLSGALLALAMTAIAFLGGFPFYQNGYIGAVPFVLVLAFAALMFIAGNLLSKRAGLLGSQLYSGQPGKAFLSFLWGCLLFIPLGLSNAAAGSPGSWMTWVNRWWIPLSQPLFSGIVEEIRSRLFLVSLCCLLLQPGFTKRPAIPLLCAVFFSAITFGLGHGGALLQNFLVTGLLYGLPMAAVFVRRDWEYAVGAHYMINMIPTLMVFLGT